MKRIVLAALCLMFALGPVAALAHGEARSVKKGILLVAFGTSEASARVSFTHIENKVREAFPGVPVQWAYTSHIIRKKLAKQGEILYSPPEALARMMDEGFTHVAVQSLHTIPGEEYHDLVMTINAFQGLPGGFESLIAGRPMLSTQDDVDRAAAAILATLPPQRKPGEAVVLMGHGTPHPANIYYAGLNWNLQQKTRDIMVGTVEGSPEIGAVEAWLKKGKHKKVWLMPFMSVAGDHAKNDMAGPGEDSWKSILEKQGFQCEPVLKGTAEYDPFVAIWVDHLRGVLSHFD